MKNYANYYHHIISLQKSLKKEFPIASKLIDKHFKESSKGGILSKKQKALMALSIAISKHSYEDLSIYLHESLVAGATRAEIIETIELCIAIGGRSTFNFAPNVYTAMIQMEEDSDEFRDSLYS